MLAGVNAAPFDIDIAATRGVIAITGASGTATAYRSAFDASGNSFVVGAFTGTVDFDPGSGTTALSSADGNDGFVAKYSPQGSLLWARRFGGPGDDRVNAVAVSESGAVYFGGRFDTAASFDSQVSTKTLVPVGGPDGFVGSFAADGSLTWIDAYGGGQYDEIDALAIQPDGNVVAVGSFDWTVDFDRGPESQTLSANNLNDVFVLSLTSSGDYRWAKQFAGSGYQYPRDAATGTDGRIVVTGSFYGTVDFDPGPGETLLTATQGLTSAFIVQLDASGGLAWAGNLGGSMQFGEAISVDAAGAVYASGVAWGTTDFAFGPIVNSKSFSGTRVYLAKYDAAGGHEWARTFLKNDSIYGSFLADRALGGVEVDSSGQVYLAGGFSGTVDFDDSAIDQSETASGTEDAYVLKWSAATGELQAVKTFGGSGSDRADGLSVSPFGQLIVSGTFASSVDFGTESPTASLGSSSGFVVVLGNQSPTDIALSASSIAENQPAGTTIGTLSTADPDFGDSFTYALIPGEGSADNASFTIVGNELRTAEVFDFETKASYSIRVRATDQSGLFTEKAFAIDVGDVHEPPVDIESGLVARYGFNGNATDSSGNGRNGIMKDTSPTNDRFGVASGALSFNGASSWVEVPHAQPLNSFPITVSAWFQSTADNPGHIVSKYENATWNGWGISVEKARVQPNSASGYYLASRTDALISLYDDYPPFEAGESLNDGTWHHIVMVVDQTSGRLYLDGVLADTQSWRGTPSAATASWPMFFGYYPHSYVGIGDMNPYFSGSIDDVRIYSRALTAEEIDLLYATELVPNGPPTEIVLSASSIAENQPTGMTVGTLSTTDPDAGDSFTYALVNGDGADDNASFTIVGGMLKASESFDYETKSSYSIRVRSTDLGGLSVETAFVIKVINLGEGAADLQQGLIARYELDGNAADASGNGRAGTATNATPAKDRFGRDNAALSFNGIDSVVVVPHDSSLNALPLSISAWFQTTATTGGIVGKYQAAGWDGYQVALGSGGTVWPWYVLSRGQDVIGNYDVAGDNNPAFRSAPLNDGKWHNIVFTVDASGGALFVDGVLQATKEWRGDPTPVTTNLPLFIGQYFGEDNGFFKGLIDDVRLYDRVLSPEEVSLLNTSVPPDVTEPPAVKSVSIAGGDGRFSQGIVMVSVTFTTPVIVDTTGGTPTLTLETGEIDRVIEYSRGSGSNTLEFSYTIQSGDTTEDLDYLSSSALALNGGTIKDGDGRDADLALPEPGAPGSIGANNQIAIDTTAPTIALVNHVSDPVNGAVGIITIGLSEPLFGFDYRDDFELTHNGELVSLEGVSWTGGDLEYFFDLFWDFNALPGLYELRLSADTAGITDIAGNALVEDAVLSWIVGVPPTDIDLSPTMVGEGLPVDTVVGLLSTIDEDVGDSFTYALVSGDGSADNAAFTIRDGELLTAETFTAAVKGSYSIRLRSTDAAGYAVEKAFTITVVGKPGRPTGLAGVAGNGSVRLTWAAPANDGGAPIMDYLIEFRRDGSTTWSTFDRAPSNATSTDVTGLSNYVRYVFRVSAVNVAGTGEASVASAVVMPLPLPGTPTGLTGRPGDGRVTLVWAAPPSAPGVPRVVDYVIQVSGNNGATWTTFADGVSAGTSTTVTGLANGSAYVFRVSAVNSAGIGSPSNPSAPVTPRRAPGSPSSLKATPGDAQVTLSWTMPVNNGGAEISDYVVQWSVNGFTWVTFADGVSTATTATVTGLANGTAYMFRVAAQNEAGVGLASPATTRVTPVGVPGSPTGVNAVFGDSQVRLTWRAPISNGGAPITDYKIEYSSDSGSTWTTHTRARSTSPSANVTGLVNGQSYVFRVSAINSAGAGEPAFSAEVMPRGVPGVPRDLQATAGNGQATLSWTAPASTGGVPITNYLVQFSLNNGLSWALLRRAASTDTSATVTGLTNGVPYVFRVTAVNMAGSGQPSARSAAVTPVSFTSLGATINGVEFGSTQLGYAFRESGLIRQVTSAGRNVTANQLGAGWTMRAVWASEGGYQAYWRSGTGASALWTLNSTGAFVSTQTLTASEVSSLETEIQFDLDKNGKVGA